MRNGVKAVFAAAAVAVSMLVSGCATAPKASDQSSFLAEAAAAREYFEARVPGLKEQIKASGGYVVYPNVGQWGIVFGGGQFGRGTVNAADGTQVGWGAVNIASIGLQAGVRGFKMLVVIQDQATFEKFKNNQLSGSVSGVVVVAETGTSGTAQFGNGVAVYQGSSSGLMAGVNVGLDYMRFKPLGDEK